METPIGVCEFGVFEDDEVGGHAGEGRARSGPTIGRLEHSDLDGEGREVSLEREGRTRPLELWNEKGDMLEFSVPSEG